MTVEFVVKAIAVVRADVGKKVLAEVVIQDLGAMRGVWAMIAMEVDVRGRAELLRGMAASRLSRLEVDYPSEWDQGQVEL